jgi:hypothetical protein
MHVGPIPLHAGSLLGRTSTRPVRTAISISIACSLALAFWLAHQKHPENSNSQFWPSMVCAKFSLSQFHTHIIIIWQVRQSLPLRQRTDRNQQRCYDSPVLAEQVAPSQWSRRSFTYFDTSCAIAEPDCKGRRSFRRRSASSDEVGITANFKGPCQLRDGLFC